MSPNRISASSDVLEPVLEQLLRDLASRTREVTTIANGKRNRISAVDRTGVFIETDSTDAKGSGPSRVPAWMLNVSWDRLTTTGSLTHGGMTAAAGVELRRSSAVFALLARLAGVTIASSKPIELRYRPPLP